MKTKAIFDDAGNCLFCGECGRCPGSHDWAELSEKKFDISQIYDLLPLSEKTLLRRLRLKVYPFGERIRNDQGTPCDYFIYDEQGKAIGMVMYYRGRKLCLHGIEIGQ